GPRQAPATGGDSAPCYSRAHGAEGAAEFGVVLHSLDPALDRVAQRGEGGPGARGGCAGRQATEMDQGAERALGCGDRRNFRRAVETGGEGSGCGRCSREGWFDRGVAREGNGGAWAVCRDRRDAGCTVECTDSTRRAQVCENRDDEGNVGAGLAGDSS